MLKITFLIPYSATALQMETVPAIKITNFVGTPICDEVYAYVKVYSLDGSLYCEMFRFEQAPPPQARMALAISPADITGKLLLISCDFVNGKIYLIIRENGIEKELTCECNETISQGSDEQGFYKCVRFCLSKSFLDETLGSDFSLKSVWKSNVFSYDTREKAYGCAFAPAQNSFVPVLGTMMPI